MSIIYLEILAFDYLNKKRTLIMKNDNLILNELIPNYLFYSSQNSKNFGHFSKKLKQGLNFI